MARRFGLAIMVLAALLYAGPAHSQMLFSQGFESYSPDPYKRGAWMNAFDVAEAFPGWTTDNYWQPTVCSCKDIRDEDARYYQYCDGYKVEPHAGCNDLMLGYGTRAGSPAMETWGGGPYLIRDFDEPLAMGQRYRLSMWIHLPDDGRTPRARLDSITSHLGAQLMYKRFVPTPFGDMFAGAQLLLDTVRYNEWYQVSWTLKPLCDLRRLVIGTFRNRSGPPTHGAEDGLNYFVDDIALERLPDDPSALEEAMGVCYFADTSLVEALPMGAAGKSVYFASNDSTLDAAARAALDGYIALVKPYGPLAFTIYGFADTRTGANQQLSDGRVRATLEYLRTAHKLQPFQSLATGFGDSRSAANALDEDRRVELRLALQVRSEIPYRCAVEQTWAGNFDAALRALRMWSVTVDDRKAALVNFDPRLETLRRTPGYAAFAKTHHARYRRYPEPKNARTLDSLFHEDQRYRTLAPRVGNLNAYFPDIDSADRRWEVSFPVDEATYNAHDAAGLAFAKTWVAEHGWPERSKVSERGVTAIVYAYLHGEDTAAMRTVEPMLETACRRGEARWLDYALLVDRRLVLSGARQRYGTKYGPDQKGEMGLLPVEDVEEMRRWRDVWGLARE